MMEIKYLLMVAMIANINVNSSVQIVNLGFAMIAKLMDGKFIAINVNQFVEMEL